MMVEVPQPEPRKVAAIMFTDMVELSLEARRDEALNHELREEHGRLVRGLLSGHGAAKSSSWRTASSSSSTRRSPRWPAGWSCSRRWRAQRVRPADAPGGAAHRHPPGPVVHRDGDIFGEGVNLAARLESLARPGSLYVSEPVVRQVESRVLAPGGAPEPRGLEEHPPAGGRLPH